MSAPEEEIERLMAENAVLKEMITDLESKSLDYQEITVDGGEVIGIRLIEHQRDVACVSRWPECYSGGFDPRCCRFPKSCSVKETVTRTWPEREDGNGQG